MNLSSPHQYRPGQKALATPNHLVDLNTWPEPRDLHCHKCSRWCGCPRGKSEDGKQMGQLQISRVGSLCYHSPCLHLLEEEAMKRWRLTPQAFYSGTLEVPGLHIHSVLQLPSAWYYSLPLFQPGTWPARSLQRGSGPFLYRRPPAKQLVSLLFIRQSC